MNITAMGKQLQISVCKVVALAIDMLQEQMAASQD